MYIDASALVAVLSDEPEALRISNAIENADQRMTSPLAVLETALALSRPDKWAMSIAELETFLMTYLDERGIDLCEPNDAWEATRFSLEAATRFRAGRRGLNLADCMHYAYARHFHVPILATADEFRQTDLAVVP